MRLLLYCTKGKLSLRKSIKDKDYYLDNGSEFNIIPKKDYVLNGKVVAECNYEVEEIFEDNFEDARDGYVEHFYTLKSYDVFDEGQEALLKKSCLQKYELSNYLGFENGYAIHIKNLHRFDKPKELSEYYSIIDMGGGMLGTKPLTNAPKNMMRVSVNRWEYCFYNPSDITILIPVSPLEMCRIANKEQTILLRKKVLRGMIK